MNIKKLRKRVENIKKRLDPEVVEREKRIENKKGMAKGIAIGSIVAGAAALFISPDSGKNNREKTKEELKKAKEFLETNITEGKEKLSKVYQDKKELINKNKSQNNLNLDDDIHIIDDIYMEDFKEELITEEY